jgi:hypothetical protein
VEDIWAYAKGRVDNKGVLQRIGHSSKLHKFRSATKSKGSFASKAAGIGGVLVRYGLKKIPVPVLSDLIAQVAQTAEQEIRSKLHNDQLKAASLSDEVKFKLKELSVADMDRYRWKLKDAIDEFNKAVDQFPQREAKKKADGAQCDAYLELVMAAQQAFRRLDILTAKCLALKETMELTAQWAAQCQNGPAGMDVQKKNIDDLIKDKIAAELAAADKLKQTKGEDAAEQEILESHGECGQWCCFRESGKPDNYRNMKDTAAKVTRFLTAQTSDSALIGSILGAATPSHHKDQHSSK